MEKKISKSDVEKIKAIINSYNLTEEDFNNRTKMDEMVIRFRADLARIGLSLECFLPDRLRKRRGINA
jgi:hypothetical protein